MKFQNECRTTYWTRYFKENNTTLGRKPTKYLLDILIKKQGMILVASKDGLAV